jgi:hypothetical protein
VSAFRSQAAVRAPRRQLETAALDSFQRRHRHRCRSVRRRSATVLSAAGPRTLYDKIFDDHMVASLGEDGGDGSNALLYIDRHLVHEVTSPQAFEGLRTAGRPVRRPECTLATVDHNVPTSDRSGFTNVETFIQQEDSRTQVMQLEENVRDFSVTYFGMNDLRQGIVHIIGPEQGFTMPGVCCFNCTQKFMRKKKLIGSPREVLLPQRAHQYTN